MSAADDSDRRQLRRRDEDVELFDRLDRLENDVLERIAVLGRELDVARRSFTLEQIEKLDSRYLQRAAEHDDRPLTHKDARVLYVPRAEHEHKRDWTIRVLLALVAVGSVLEPVAFRFL